MPVGNACRIGDENRFFAFEPNFDVWRRCRYAQFALQASFLTAASVSVDKNGTWFGELFLRTAEEKIDRQPFLSANGTESNGYIYGKYTSVVRLAVNDGVVVTDRLPFFVVWPGLKLWAE